MTFGYYKNYLYTTGIISALKKKKKKKVKSPRCMVSHPETGSDPPIGLDRESGRDTIAICEITNRKVKNDIKSVFVYVSFTFHRYYKGIILINA